VARVGSGPTFRNVGTIRNDDTVSNIDPITLDHHGESPSREAYRPEHGFSILRRRELEPSSHNLSAGKTVACAGRSIMEVCG
jgi:hypothetical protein